MKIIKDKRTPNVSTQLEQNVLKLATRAKLHMGHPIYGSGYFSWIPLSERYRIDLEIL